MKKTPLNPVHHAAGARLVDFGGWEMPVHYGSQIEEHHAVRRDAGMFDVSHMLAVDVLGAGAREFLRRALANNIDKLRTPGKALYSCLLAEDGGVIDDLIAYFFRDDFFRIVVNAATAERDLAWLEALHTSWNAAVRLVPRRDLAMIAVQGPNARAKVWQAFPELRAASEPLAPFSAALVDEAVVARTGYTGEDGFEIALPAAPSAATFWWPRSTPPASSSTRPTNSWRWPRSSSAARPTKSRPSARSTVHASPASSGETRSSMSWP